MRKNKNISQVAERTRRGWSKLSMLNRSSLFMISLVMALSFSLSTVTNVLAVSVYDDNFVTTNTATVDATSYGSVCNPTDLTNNWRSYILDSSKWRSGDDWSVARSSLLAAFANSTHGQWGVSESEIVGNSSAGNGYDKSVVIFWSEDPIAEFDWANYSASDQVAYTGTVNLVRVACSDAYWGDSNPNPVIVGAVLGSPLSWVSQKAGSICGANSSGPVQWCATRNLFSYNVDPNYPSGYQGATVQSGSAMTPVIGNVQCANEDNIISNIQINAQSGMDGNATIADDGNGGKNYSYYPSEESPYSLVVICDGDIFYGPTVDVNLYNSYDWVCVPTSVSEDPDVKLGTCAAS